MPLYPNAPVFNAERNGHALMVRDHVALTVLHALIVSGRHEQVSVDELTYDAYEIADAMIERSNNPDDTEEDPPPAANPDDLQVEREEREERRRQRGPKLR